MTITITGIVIAFILIFFFAFGVKTGLVKAVFDLLAFFLTWLLTWIFYPYLAALLIKTPVYDSIYKWINITLADNRLVNETVPEFFLKIPDFIKDSIVISSKQALENIVSSTVDALTVLAINAISILILYFVFRFLSILIKKIGRKINKIAIIGPVNMLLGGAFGIIRGLLIIYVVMMVISCFPTTKLYSHIANDIEKCYISGTMFNEEIKIMGLSVRYPVNDVN